MMALSRPFSPRMVSRLAPQKVMKSAGDISHLFRPGPLVIVEAKTRQVCGLRGVPPLVEGCERGSFGGIPADAGERRPREVVLTAALEAVEKRVPLPIGVAASRQGQKLSPGARVEVEPARAQGIGLGGVSMPLNDEIRAPVENLGDLAGGIVKPLEIEVTVLGGGRAEALDELLAPQFLEALQGVLLLFSEPVRELFPLRFPVFGTADQSDRRQQLQAQGLQGVALIAQPGLKRPPQVGPSLHRQEVIEDGDHRLTLRLEIVDPGKIIA